VNALKQQALTTIRPGQSDPLPVMEQFYTLQGEGHWAGSPAWFIRLAGCDVGCHWCDVKDSWAVHPDQYLSAEAIARQAAASGAPMAVITGGEPTIYDLGPLTRALHAAGLRTHIETAGVHPLTGDFDWVCFSPKKFMAPLETFYPLCHELKVVIFRTEDTLWAEDHAAKCPPHTVRFLQPEWSRQQEITPRLIDYVKAHPHWRLSIQTHKYLDIP
jgi:organic radical activating enzyme